MNVVRQSNNNVIMHMGGPLIKTKGKKYRFNKYLIELDIKEGKLLYNSMTGALIMIRPFEYINVFTDDPCDYADFMVNNYFIVPEKYDEDAVIKDVRMKMRPLITENYLEHPNAFTILTTTKCNAHCFYCYELKSKNKHHMTIETAEKVAKYIMQVSPNKLDIRLDWFGGEPLFNSDVIDIITSRLLSAGCKFTSSMISNGYLFTEELVNRAAKEWNLKNIQITLDGPEEIYNKVKNYSYKDDSSPYKRVIENIHKLIGADINVSVRINCDSHNYNNIVTLLDDLKTEFSNDIGKFSVYIWPIFEEGFVRTEQERADLFSNMMKINESLCDDGFPMIDHFSGIKGIHCQVDSGDGVTISPDGDLGVCEHYIDSKFWGTIDNYIDKNYEHIVEWRNYQDKTEICKDCPLSPQCLRLKQCPDETNCSIQEKDYLLHQFKLSLKQAWEKYLNNPQEEQSCNGGCKCGEYIPKPGEKAIYQRVFTDSNGKVRTEIVNNYES